MTQSDTKNPQQTGEDKQADVQSYSKEFPPELGERAGQPREWTISRVESVIGSVA